MNTSFTDREKQILEQLNKKGDVSIQELAETFSVSTMTIHRDLNRLEEMGQLRKRHGGASLIDDDADAKNPCAMCGKSTVGKKTFIIHLATGEQKITCCAHCGLMLLTVTKGAWQSMTMDFLHGHMISANQAIYLIGCDLNVCCVPTILTFGSQLEAQRFQTGFGGKLASMDEAIQFLLG
jgi:DeoR family transcriptional regulator, copper-sensing transcriptional repressor